VKGITGESFVLESLILPEGISVLCDDAGLSTTMLAMLPTLDESCVAVRQTGGRDPHRGIQISNAPVGGPQTAGVAPSAPARASTAAPAPWTRAKGLQAAPRPQAAPGCRRKRGDAGCAAPTDHLFRTPPVGAEEASSQAQGMQRRVSPPPPQPPPPSGPPPTTTPGDDLPQGHQQQQHQ
jgi:hypothetical protein